MSERVLMTEPCGVCHELVDIEVEDYCINGQFGLAHLQCAFGARAAAPERPKLRLVTDE